jgi:LysM repeat protein
VAVVVVLAAGYYFLVRDDEADAGGAKVVQVQVSNQVGQNGALVNPGIIFPAGTRQMAASVVLEGVRAGQRVRGTWYQLGVTDAAPEGSEARTSETVLNADTISPEGRSRVSFSLAVGGNGFSGNSIWLLRVYVNDALAATNGFAISTAAGLPPAGGSAPPAGGAPPPAPRTYTVVQGDTLLIVAQKNLPPGTPAATANTLATEIATLNNIAPNAPLVPNQVLRLP